MFNNPKGSWSNQVMGCGSQKVVFLGKGGFIFDASGEQWQSHCSHGSKIKGGGYAKLVRQTDWYFPPPIVNFLRITSLLKSCILSLEKSCFSVGSVAFWRGYASFWFSGFWACLTGWSSSLSLASLLYVNPEFSRGSWWWAVLLSEFG